MGILDKIYSSAFPSLFVSGAYTDNMFLVNKGLTSLYGLEDQQASETTGIPAVNSGEEG
jgi:hypothetical protein